MFLHRNVRPFKGSEDKDFQRGGAFYSTSLPVQQGADEADKSLKMSCEERLSLVVELQPSDDEDDEMDFDREFLLNLWRSLQSFR